MGNFILVDATPATVANGQTPVTIDWDYLQIAYGAEFKSNITWEVTVPADAVVGQLLLPGDQRQRAASLCRAALAGVPLLGRGPAALVEGLSRTRRGSRTCPTGTSSRRICWTSCPPRILHECPVPDPGTNARGATKVITDGWAAVGG